MEKMSSMELEGLFPKISSSSSIQELIKLLEYSFLKSEFDEVQNILTDRENSMKVERESFERDRHSIKKDLDLLRQDKLELESKLKEKSKMILQLNREIKELKNQKLENEQTAVKFKEKIESMKDEEEKLKREKLEADQNVEVYKKRFEDLSARFGKTEQILAKIFKVSMNDLSTLENNIEKDVNFWTCDGEKESSRNDGKWSGGNAVFGNSDLEHFRNERSLKSGADAGDALSLVHPARKSSGTGINCSQERATGGDVDLSSQTKEAGANGYNVPQSSPGKQSACDPSQTESRHDITVDLDHGEQVTNNLVLAGSSSKIQSLKSVDIIEISDSDDEASPEKFAQSPTLSQTNGKTRADYIEGPLGSPKPKRKRSTNESDNDEIFSNGAHQENRTRGVNYEGSGSPINNLENPKSMNANLAKTVMPSMRNPVHVRRCEEKAVAKSDSQTPSKASDGINVNDSTGSEDESYSSSCINNMVGSFLVKKKSKAWMFGADMLKDFEEDPELCLNAVCALHRQQISPAKSNVGLTLIQSGGLSHSDALSIRSLGEYLIEGDPQHRLRKSVSEVKQQRPDVLSQCLKLSINHYERLFEIYCKEEDPFFGSR